MRELATVSSVNYQSISVFCSLYSNGVDLSLVLDKG